MTTPWIWPPVTSGGGGGGGGSSGTVLKFDDDRFLDPVNGNDAANGATPGTAWQTFAPFAAFLESLSEIEDAFARLTILPSDVLDVASMNGLNIPLLSGSGKVIIRGTESVGMPASPGPGTVSITADAGSTTTAINVAAFPSTHNPIGWQLICTAGANVGARRLCTDWVVIESAGDPTVLTPSAALDNAGVGDTWILAKPAAGFVWAGIIQGVGQLPRSLGDANDPGIYISNLGIQATPSAINCELTLLGIDYIVAGGDDGFIFGAGTQASFGTLGTGVTAIDPTSDLWSGYGIGCRRELNPTLLIHTIHQFNPSSAFGYVVGSAWSVTGAGSFGLMYGGRLFGVPSGNAEPTINVTAGANFTISVDAAPAVKISAPASATAILYSADHNTIVYVSNVAFDNDAGEDTTILRATNGGTIQTTNGGPSGFSNTLNQDASNGGTIIWDANPDTNFAGTMAVTGLTGRSTLLALEQSAFQDALGLSKIVRQAAGVVTATRQQSPALPPFNGSRILTRITDGTLTTLLSAPAAGVLRVFPGIGVHNSGVAAGTPNITVGGIRVDVYASIAAAADGGVGMAPIVTNAALTAQRVAGTSTAMDYRGAWCEIPQANLVPFIMQLTAAYVAIASIVPAAGFISRVWQGDGVLYSASNQRNWTIVNNDSVAHIVNLRITSVAQQFVTASASVPAGSFATVITPYLPSIAPSDTVEVETAEAIVTAGSVVLYGVQEIVPQPP